MNAVMVGASECDSFALRRCLEGSSCYVVAVDGGYKALEAVGCVPDCCVGDFDSLGFVPECAEVYSYPPVKDASDLELALSLLEEKDIFEVRIFGVLGGRFDHSLATLASCSAYAKKGFSIHLVGVHEDIRFVSPDCSLTLEKKSSGYVSVFSWTNTSTGVSIEGLAYELDNQVLTNDVSLGLSNEFIGKPAKISVREGLLLVVIPK